MPGNSFGQLFRITTFGESHGDGFRVIMDAMAALMVMDHYLRHRAQSL